MALVIIFWVALASFAVGIGMEFLAECPSNWRKLMILWGFLASLAAAVLLHAIALE